MNQPIAAKCVSLITREQLAGMLGVCLRTVDTLTKSRAIPSIKLGRTVRYDPEKVREALNRLEVAELGRGKRK